MKRTLKRELKQCLKLLRAKRRKPVAIVRRVSRCVVDSWRGLRGLVFKHISFRLSRPDRSVSGSVGIRGKRPNAEVGPAGATLVTLSCLFITRWVGPPGADRGPKTCGLVQIFGLPSWRTFPVVWCRRWRKRHVLCCAVERDSLAEWCLW